MCHGAMKLLALFGTRGLLQPLLATHASITQNFIHRALVIVCSGSDYPD